MLYILAFLKSRSVLTAFPEVWCHMMQVQKVTADSTRQYATQNTDGPIF
jgi:hypothetical protein